MSQQRLKLAGQEAVDLWKKGKDAWNAWVDEHPEADIDFTKVDFSPYNMVSFEGFRFPSGDVSFVFATFGDSYVRFDGATFGEGKVDFRSATFDEGIVSFSDATFGEGDVRFGHAKFGKSTVSFENATFGEGVVDFRGANFGDGSVYFNNTNFGEGNVSFLRATFGDGIVSFEDATFGEGNVSFFGATFGKGDVDFQSATFDKGDVNFYGANFGKGSVGFLGAKFGEGDVSFAFAQVEGAMFLFSGCTLQKGRYDFSHMRIDAPVLFDGLKNTELPTRFSFQNTSFEQSVVFAGHFHCVPDFRGTKTLHHMDINELRCDLRRKRGKAVNLPWPHDFKAPSGYELFSFCSLVASDTEDAARLRRLKEIAESNRHHAAALRFHAGEMRAMRWLERGFFASVLDWIYDKLSDYGQSLWRPLRGWLVTLTAFFLLYWILSFIPGMGSNQALTCWENRLSQALSVSFGNSIPFAPTARGVRLDGLKTLFGKDPSLIVDILTLCQGVVSFIFLFLIGLALRNRFRI